jgi:two-component sensor histidine kinase
MRLKMHELNSAEAEAQYRDTINRVMAMSKIHEKMYSSEEITNVDLEKYFDDLSKELIFTYQTDREVSFHQDIRVKQLDLDQIVPLALIFNELFSNSLEHAFEKIDVPRIDLLLDWNAEKGVVFDYRDNGMWKTSTNQSSFGLDLIQSLTEQLNGTLIAEVEPTHYRLTFPAARS